MPNKIKKLLVTSATSFELVPFMEFLDKEAEKRSFFEYVFNGISIFPLVTGVGPIFTAFSLSRFNDIKDIDLAINIGIAGAFDSSVIKGTVFQVVRDCFGDIGVEESDASFTDVFDLELMDQNSFPFSNKWINNDSKKKINSKLPIASCLTVNRVAGTTSTISTRSTKYGADIESMEGAAFAYACKMMQVEYMQLRAVSNHVEIRNKENWTIDLAIKNVNAELINSLRSMTLHVT